MFQTLVRFAVTGLICFCLSAFAQQVEVFGTWTLTDQYGTMTSTISDSTFIWQRPSVQGAAKITYYNNGSNVLVMQHTVHPDPDQLNKFMKLTWTPAVPGMSADMCTYQSRSTQDSAITETSIFPDDYPRPATKIQSSVFFAGKNKSIIPLTTSYRSCFMSKNSYIKAESMFSINGSRISKTQAGTKMVILKNR